MSPLTNRRAPAAVLALVTLLAFGADAPARSPRPRHDGPHDRHRQEPVVLASQGRLLAQLDDMTERIAAVKAIVDVGLRGDARDRALEELAALRRQALDVREAVRSAAPLPVPPKEPPPPMAPMALDEADFAALLAAIDAEAHGSSKLRVLADATSHAWFSVDQVKRVLAKFSFSSDQLQALKLLAPQLADPQNSFRIYESFTFDSDKEKARQILTEGR